MRLSSGDYERNCRRRTRSASNAATAWCTVVWRSVSVLVETRIHLVWRTHRPDRDHANRAGRKEKMDQPVAFSARAELLHAPSRSRSAAARDLYRLAPAQSPRRYRRRRALRYSFDLRSLGSELYLRGVWKSPVDRRDLLWIKA